MKNDRIYIRIDADLKAQAQAYASDTGRTLAGLIEWLLRQELKKGVDIQKEMKKRILSRAEQIAQEIRASGEWKPDLLKELCALAGMATEWEAADGETFEAVAYAAAARLGVEI
jgi:hypothetical protein